MDLSSKPYQTVSDRIHRKRDHIHRKKERIPGKKDHIHRKRDHIHRKKDRIHKRKDRIHRKKDCVPNIYIKVKVSRPRDSRVGGPELIPGLSHQPAVGMCRARPTVRWPICLSVPQLPSQHIKHGYSIYSRVRCSSYNLQVNDWLKVITC